MKRQESKEIGNTVDDAVRDFANQVSKLPQVIAVGYGRLDTLTGDRVDKKKKKEETEEK